MIKKHKRKKDRLLCVNISVLACWLTWTRERRRFRRRCCTAPAQSEVRGGWTTETPFWIRIPWKGTAVSRFFPSRPRSRRNRYYLCVRSPREKPERLKKPEQAGQPERLKKPEQPGQPERLKKPEQPQRPEDLEKPEQLEKPENRILQPTRPIEFPAVRHRWSGSGPWWTRPDTRIFPQKWSGSCRCWITRC